MPISKRRELANEKRARERAKQEKQQKELNPQLVDLCLNKDNKPQPQKQKRTRRFCLTTYIDTTKVKTFLQGVSWVQHWAMITHDRDVNEDGSAKQPHTHILLYTYDAKVSSAVKKRFDYFSAELYKESEQEAQNTLVQECHDMTAQWRYLRHLDDKEKAQYTLDEVECDDLAYWNTLDTKFGMTDCTTNSGLAILRDFMSGVDTYTMCERYGKEYIYHMSHYKAVACNISSESAMRNFSSFRDMCDFALADATFTQYETEVFYNILAYVQAKFSEEMSLNEQVNKYLKA